MHTVCETPAFQRAAEAARLVRGCRKLRLGGRGKGKSGGYRVVTFFTGKDLPVFLVTVFGKGEQANLNKAERNALAKLAKALVSVYRKKVVLVGAAG
jgi:hypothetical protein